MGCVGLIYVIFYSGAMERIAKVFGNTVNRMDMFKKSLLLTLVMCLLFSSFADAKRRHKRSSHRSQHHHYYRDNSASKQEVCSEGYVDYFGVCKGKDIKQDEDPKPAIQKKKINKTNKNASNVKNSQPDLREKTAFQQKKNVPTCAPLNMAHKPGYTNLPICVDGEY
ncbi:TPA: hypothetical protein JXT23_003832 [Escherichia coli]|uniref:hypothetical protein n=1 Tax=Escherichia coli TaxID=562 RepID=UPI000B7D00A2|nr:hypothetical protein [Escherichia coli]EET0751745.1 hypothetical protein [Escherichia coli]EET5103717.1 hypothetical protein [Escherichia coli]EFB3673562.1 hypothetical protein [Escherichia coli]EHI0110370.1 hypothetical protein [Escherichia coli]EKS8776509.1 hypothetical protein [Escherichia coli]